MVGCRNVDRHTSLPEQEAHYLHMPVVARHMQRLQQRACSSGLLLSQCLCFCTSSCVSICTFVLANLAGASQRALLWLPAVLPAGSRCPPTRADCRKKQR